MRRALRLASGLLAAVAVAHAAEAPRADEAAARTSTVVRWVQALDPSLRDRLLALDPDAITPSDVATVLRHAPAPRVIALNGSVPVVTMEPLARFLAAMGYPEERLRDPRDGARSRSSYRDSRHLAGELAWHLERDGMVPILVGHSQGGMVVIRVLHELAGRFGPRVAVWDPLAQREEPRHAVRDPLTGAERPVVGLRVPYAAALATGKLPRVLAGQWDMLPLLRSVPDSVEAFTGFSLPWDPIAGTFGADEPYRAEGSAQVRNVTLPASYRHVALPLVEHLAADPVTRAWIERYAPGRHDPLPDAPGIDAENLVHAADIWFSLKRHWCIEAQRLAREQPRLAAAGRP